MDGWARGEIMRRIDGKPECELSKADYKVFAKLERDGYARSTDGIVRRIPVSYGDGKKSPYGVTYADDLTGEFS